MLGMKIEEVKEDGNQIEITTTGAKYVFKKTEPAEIICYQRIGEERLVGKVIIEDDFSGLKSDSQNEELAILYQPVGDFGFNIRVYPDSLLSVRAGGYRMTKVTYRGDWFPEYSSFHQGNFMVMDKNGGIAAYPLSGGGYGLSGSTENDIRLGSRSWEVSLFVRGGQTFLTSVFPPRAFDFKKSVSDRIVHHFISGKDANGFWSFYPQDEMMDKYVKYGNILVLHTWQKGFKDGKVKSREELYREEAGWAVSRYIPIEERKLRRVVYKAHGLGMKVIPYMSPIFFPGEVIEFLDEMERIVGEYNFDGVYFDGVANDIWRAYTIMKNARRRLGNRILYVHIPSPIIGKSYPSHYIYCPFIDAYADYILRMEHIFNFDEAKGDIPYLLGGYGISNSIAFVCNYDYPPEVTKRLIPLALENNFRIPYWVGWDPYLKERQGAVGREFYPEEQTHGILEKEYFPFLLNQGR